MESPCRTFEMGKGWIRDGHENDTGRGMSGGTTVVIPPRSLFGNLLIGDAGHHGGLVILSLACWKGRGGAMLICRD